MVLKRGFSGEMENDNPHFQTTQQQNQRFKFTKCICKDKKWLQAYSAQLENSIRKVLREEVEQAIQQSYHSILRLMPSQVKPSESRKFKLQFEDKLPDKLFTGNKVEAEGPSPIKIYLLDAITGHRVTDGPLSSVKVKIVVLHGHFKAEELDNWTEEEFDNNIVFERDGKRPLLIGQHLISLQNGVCCVGNICFTDNSSWERSKMFRLGAKVEAKGHQVREAVSSPFEVKDRRGENYQKHKIPAPEDEVWRLCWIAKDGKISKRLAEHHIYKVKDFVKQYYLDESLLRQILNVTPKKWEAIIQRATSCFSGDSSQSLSDSAPIDAPISNTNCPITVPGLNMQQFCMPPSCYDQPENRMSHYHTEDYSHHLHQSMALNNPLVMDLLAGSCSEDGSLPSLEDCMLPPFPNVFDFETSSWFHASQLMGEEGNSGDYMGFSHNSDIGMPSFTPNVIVNASETAKPKGWSKVRAIMRVKVKHDEAVRKGKFQCFSQ
ncbi:protein SAR DEFICIENT 1-like isoform X1 [Chenopodium quinoa]|uniref:protein SAR DEFICIENT 1-like isoform X1 n=1 Tax=Chenopodium quinoa TaxID=63459 RepID=UPI000B76EE35|nr:protein SAR DEFICIENT 1-like isoform X1 [Chenopodium quinoa]